jgi:predicted helicase
MQAVRGRDPQERDRLVPLAAATDEYADSLLIHTGSGFSANAAATIAAQRSPCEVVDLERLLQSDVVWPLSIDALDTGAKKPPQDPQEHQLAALARIRSEFLSSGRTRTWVNMACGSGKTLVATLAADEFAPELAVVFCAETVALHEAVRAWTRNARLNFAALRICSKQDATTSDDPNLPHENRTTSGHEIAAFLAREGRRVVFCTYRSATRLAEAAAAAGVTFDLIVADDAHHIASHRTSAMTKAILDDESLPARRRLFLTATPRTWETGALRTAKRRGARVVDMRDSITGDFGARAYHLPYLDGSF